MLLMSLRGRGISGLVLALATVGGSLAGIADLAAAQTVREVFQKVGRPRWS